MTVAPPASKRRLGTLYVDYVRALADAPWIFSEMKGNAFTCE